MLDGSAGSSIFTDGLLDRQKMGNVSENAADFDTVAEADTAATANGWSIDRSTGRANHRCPKCRFEDYQPTGMYIDSRTMTEVFA
jgi:hypothetical protein